MTMLKEYFAKFSVIGLCFIVLGTESCKKLVPPEVIPCYGHLDSINVDVSNNPTYYGTASSNITCAWVYVDDQPVGAFSMPCTFPILASSGTHTITIYPGITADGITSIREKYPFYAYYDEQVNITAGKVTMFKYTAQYTSNAQIDWLEDFDGPSNISISKSSPPSDTDMFKVGSPDAFENESGEVVLDSNNPSNYHTYYTGMSDSMTLPHDGSQVFMEMNYNANALFDVGVYYYDPAYSTYVPTNFLVYVYPTNGWKKMYIDLGPGVANHNTGPFKIYFSMVRPYGMTEAKLILDNIKVLQFKGA